MAVLLHEISVFCIHHEVWYWDVIHWLWVGERNLKILFPSKFDAPPSAHTHTHLRAFVFMHEGGRDCVWNTHSLTPEQTPCLCPLEYSFIPFSLLYLTKKYIMHQDAHKSGLFRPINLFLTEKCELNWKYLVLSNMSYFWSI